MQLMQSMDYSDWIDMYLKLTSWDLELRGGEEQQMREVIYDQRRECNVEFGKFIEKVYPGWIQDKGDRPRLSVDVVKDSSIPR